MRSSVESKNAPNVETIPPRRATWPSRMSSSPESSSHTAPSRGWSSPNAAPAPMTTMALVEVTVLGRTRNRMSHSATGATRSEKPETSGAGRSLTSRWFIVRAGQD